MALIVCLLMMLTLSALGAGLVMTTTSESLIAGNFERALEARDAAAAITARGLADLRTIADWNGVLAGTRLSPFVDGAPGVRALADGTSLDLRVLVSLANCGARSGCTAAQMNTNTADRPWGVNNPRWQLFAYGRLADLLPAGRLSSSCYVVLMAADDQSETDGNPAADEAVPGAPGHDVIRVRGEAFCASGAHQGTDVTVRRGAAGVRVLSWRVRRRLDRP
jgi:hypothetical protein